jgi:alpha-L-fucosidase 2
MNQYFRRKGLNANSPMKRVCLLLACVISLATSTKADEGQRLRLWYKSPATVWNEALPVGNGRIGAMCFGNPASECLQLNEDTFWSGGPSRNDNPKAYSVLDKVRNLIFTNNYNDVEKIIDKNITAQTLHGSKYLCVGNLKIIFEGHNAYTDYERELDISNALWHTRYKVGGVEYRREVFASIPDQVLVVHLTASEPGKLTFKASLSGEQQQTVAADNGAESIRRLHR